MAASANPRNLIVCLDGTSNEFSARNSNVIKLFSLLEISDRQKAFYDSGIGTYVGNSWKTSIEKKVATALDFAVAWNFSDHVQGAYIWLMNTYKDGDKIYIFGFSRGAYAARTLAGMIEKVGLLPSGMDKQVPLAWEVYSHPERARARGAFEGSDAPKKGRGTAAEYRSIFSRSAYIDIHFVGVWDTVAALGLWSNINLPFASGVGSVSYFRQALALDERRAKFQPEFRHADDVDHIERHVSAAKYADVRGERDVNGVLFGKECWFVGAHSDVGGGNAQNGTHQLSHVPLRWMVREAFECGIKLSPTAVCKSHVYNSIASVLPLIPTPLLPATKTDIPAAVPATVDVSTIDVDKIVHTAAHWDCGSPFEGPNISDDLDSAPQESLSLAWWPVEYLWFQRWKLSPDGLQRHKEVRPNLGKGRTMLPSQKIHRSVYVKVKHGMEQHDKAYIPHTSLDDAHERAWPAFVDSAQAKDRWEY